MTTRVEVRIGSTLYYVLKDHLGSASVVTNSTGTIVGEGRFYPFGETRFTTRTCMMRIMTVEIAAEGTQQN